MHLGKYLALVVALAAAASTHGAKPIAPKEGSRNDPRRLRDGDQCHSDRVAEHCSHDGRDNVFDHKQWWR